VGVGVLALGFSGFCFFFFFFFFVGGFFFFFFFFGFFFWGFLFFFWGVVVAYLPRVYHCLALRRVGQARDYKGFLPSLTLFLWSFLFFLFSVQARQVGLLPEVVVLI